MRGSTVFCSLALIALIGMQTLAAVAEAAKQECPQDASGVVIRAIRFSEDPPAYTFMVTNNTSRPLTSLSIGMGVGLFGQDQFIEASEQNQPTSVGAPSDWEGWHVLAKDPRLPNSESRTLIKYRWFSNDDPKSWIQPGQSLSGFSVQFPGLKTPSEDGKQPAPFDLSNVPFRASLFSARCPQIGMVEPD